MLPRTENKIKNIVIITDCPIHSGLASANRILSYAKGFQYHKWIAEIIIFRKTEPPGTTKSLFPEGYIDGVKYRYLFKTPVKSANYLKRRSDNFAGLLKLFLFSVLYIKRNSLLIYYSPYTLPVISLRLARIINKTIILKEESEHPSVYTRERTFIDSFIFNNIHYYLFDGFLLMTRNLMQYFERKFPGKAKTQIPMTVNLERFSEYKKEKKKVITYLGSLNDSKDGVGILIKAYALVVEQFPEFSLNIYGEAESGQLKKYYDEEVLKYNLQSKVFFKGSVSRDKVPDVLNESGVLVLPRPDSIQARNGFPTKLGEYLATGNPVVVTSIGEIPDYLVNKESAFLVKAGSVENLAETICNVLSDMEFAKTIGLKGKKIAETYFDEKKQAKKIIEFVREAF